jgi:hypothetical protein
MATNAVIGEHALRSTISRLALVATTIDAGLDNDQNIARVLELIPESDRLIASAFVSFAETVAEYEEVVNHD